MKVVFSILIILFSVYGSAKAITSSGTGIEYIPYTKNLGIGYVSPTQKLSVNGTAAVAKLISSTNINGTRLTLLEGSSPGSPASNYGHLYVNSSNSRLYFINDAGTSFNLTNGSTPVTDAGTLDSIDSTSFLRSDASDSFTSGTLTLDASTTFDVNSTSVSIADTDITLDGASTTFTQSTGAITLKPANGSNLNVDLRGVGDFTVDSNKFVVNNNGNVGIASINPRVSLQVNGAIAFNSNNSTVTVTEVGGIDPGNRSMMRIACDNFSGCDITANPQIADGVDGQMLILTGGNVTGYNVQLDDGAGLELSTGSFTVRKFDVITLLYDALNDIWIEVSRSDN